jgi:hypothetical protein
MGAGRFHCHQPDPAVLDLSIAEILLRIERKRYKS